MSVPAPTVKKSMEMRIFLCQAVRDTAVEERDGKIIKSRRQHVCGREYIVFAEFSFGGTQSTVDLMKQVIDLEQDAKIFPPENRFA